MSLQSLQGTSFVTEDKLDKLRLQIQGNSFQSNDEIRRFTNRYIAANSNKLYDKSSVVVNEIVGDIRSELGLGISERLAVTKVISDQVSNLLIGRLQASEDTSRWAVHHAANQVTMFSGQFGYKSEDIFIDGAGMDFRFQRTYKNQGYNNGPMGINWDHNYNLRLHEVDGEEQIVVLTGHFQENSYLKHGYYGTSGFNYWIPPPGEHSIIIDLIVPSHHQEFNIQLPQSCQNCRYALRTAKGLFYLFENDSGFAGHYRIKRIQDRFKNYLEFVYEQDPGATISRIKQIFINNPQRKVLFGYDSLDRLTFIKDYVGRIWRYLYDDYGDLIAFITPGTERYKAGLTEHYRYSTEYYTGELQHNLTEVHDTAGRLYLENQYGIDKGLLSYNRVIRQREGNGERFFEYEDVSLASGLPQGQDEIKELMPAHQTVMVRRNGHPVHYIYNGFGNLIAREEDIWSSGTRQRSVSHYQYNRDGALIGELSPEGRLTQHLYGRDKFIHEFGDLSEEALRQSHKLTWNVRLNFGNRLTLVKRATKNSIAFFQFPSPIPNIYDVVTDSEDVIVKFTYNITFQDIESISDPRYTNSPFPGDQEDSHYKKTLTTFNYDQAKGYIKSIKYPNIVQADQSILNMIEENFIEFDKNGRLTKYQDRTGTMTKLSYFPKSSNQLEAAKEGYACEQIIDPTDQNNPVALNLRTKYNVNSVGIITDITLPKGTELAFKVNELNQVTQAARTLSQNIRYETRYIYCRNMRTDRIERDILDENGQPLWGGVEVQFFHYDENNNVVRQQLGSANWDEHLITRFTYDDGNLPIGREFPRGNRIRTEYDERRLPKLIERGTGSLDKVQVKFVYDGDGLLRSHWDGRGLKTEFDYDSFGRVFETRDYDGQKQLYRVIRHDYDKAGNLTIERVFKPSGNNYQLIYHQSYSYDELNQRIATDLRRLSSPVWYSRSDLQKKNDKVPSDQSIKTHFFYDKSGRPIRIEQHGKRLNANGQLQSQDTILTTYYEYNAVGWLTAQIDSLGNRTEIRYDQHGLVTRIDVREKVPLTDSATGEEIFTTLYQYDILDRLKSITDGLGNTSRFEYDSRDSIIRQEDPLGNIIHFEYDIYGRQVVERIEMTETGLGGGPRLPNSDIVTQFLYDANGNLNQLIDAYNISTYQSYDALDRRTELRYVDGTTSTFKYDGNNNMVWQRDNNGLVKKTTYDPLDNPAQIDIDKTQLKSNIVVEGATYESFEYDIMGRLVRAKNDGTDIHFELNSLGYVNKETITFSDQSQTFTIQRSYDDFGFLSQLTYPNGRVLAYQADALNRIKSVENRSHGSNYPGRSNLPQQRLILENSYRGVRIGTKLYGNGASTEYTYDGAGRIISLSHKDTQNDELLTIQTLCDANGNIRIKREFAPNDNYGEVYKYDSRSQLTRYEVIQPPPTNVDRLAINAMRPKTAMLPDDQYNDQSQVINLLLGDLKQDLQKFTFRYDALGNRQEERDFNQQPIIYLTNNLNQYFQRENTHCKYDPNGNLCREKTNNITRDYIYNHRNQIVRVNEGVDLVRFRYDALGRRVCKETGVIQVYFLYDQENVIEEWCLALQQGTEFLRQYINEFDIDSRCQFAAQGKEYWFHKDLIGSCRLFSGITGSQASTEGNPIQPLKYRYNPFGALMGINISFLNSYLFAGRYYDAELDSYDFRARQYDAKKGSFLQRDPNQFSNSMNLYYYARNNPMYYLDPKGQMPFGGSKVEVNSIARVVSRNVSPATQAKVGKAIQSGVLGFGNFIWNVLTQNPIYQTIAELQDVIVGGVCAATGTDIEKNYMASNIGKASVEGATPLENMPQVAKNVIEVFLWYYGGIAAKKPQPSLRPVGRSNPQTPLEPVIETEIKSEALQALERGEQITIGNKAALGGEPGFYGNIRLKESRVVYQNLAITGVRAALTWFRGLRKAAALALETSSKTFKLYATENSPAAKKWLKNMYRNYGEPGTWELDVRGTGGARRPDISFVVNVDKVLPK